MIRVVNRIVGLGLVLALLLSVLFGAILLSANFVFASSCSTFGNTSYCDDGTSYSQFGNTIYGSDGTSYTTFGNTTYGSDGSSASTFGNTTYTNDGTSYSTFGNTTYGSDGSSYSTFGNTTYGSGNTYSTCPANSSKDSLTGKCSCNYGYSVNSSKTSCVYTGTTYTTPTTPTCPINSYYDGISSCKCNYGYVVSGSSCVYKPTSASYSASAYSAYTAASNTSSCPANSHTNPSDSTKCLCDTGFQVNAAKTSCVIDPVVSNNQACSNANGTNSTWDGTLSSSGLLNCACRAGFTWDGTTKSCKQTVTQTQTAGAAGATANSGVIADLQAQIKALVAQLAALQAAKH